MTPAESICRAGCDAEFFTDRFGQVFDDMHFKSKLTGVQRGFLDTVRFGQANHVDAFDTRGFQCNGKRTPVAMSEATCSREGIESVLSSYPSNPEYDGEYCPFLK